MPRWTEEQSQAINNEGTNIIVSAGAGSGKTAVLTARVIRKLKQGVNINELLILTFTKAAAHEMKERIRKEIKKDESLKEQLNLIDSAYITTFDSYALSIVKKYHYLLNVSPNIGICDSSLINLEKEKIIDNIFNKFYEAKNPLFLKLIDDFCVKDDKDIRNYIINIDNKLNLKINKNEYINDYIDNCFNDKKLDDDTLKYINLIKEKIKEIEQLLHDIQYLCDGQYYTKLYDSLKPLLDSKNYLDIKNNLDVKLPQVPKNSEDELKKQKQNLSDLIKNIKLYCEYDSVSDIKDKIVLSKNYVTIILEIIKEIDKQLFSYKQKNNLFEFNDIVKMSINVIERNENVKQELKSSLNEIMIDEYQDTNDLQEYFISLISNNNVYMVGDIKQSIYRFRNANPDIFKNKYHQYKNKLNGIKIDLNKNFRSRKEVLNNINLLFDYLMDETLGGAEYKESHQMIFGNNLYEENKPNQNYDLEVLYYDKDSKYYKEEIEFFKVVNDIKNKIENNYQIFDKDNNVYRDASYNDFVILVDRASSFELGKKIFEYMKIPLTLYKDDTITNSYDLMVLRNIILLVTKVLKKEYDEEYKYLFVSLARSFIFEYSDELIFNLIKENKINDDEIIIKINKICNNIQNLSITDILDNIIIEFNIYENFLKIGNINDSLVRLEYLYELSKTLQSIGYTIYEFGEYLKDINDKKYEIKVSADKPNSNSVRIMTIHKSKGLEFPICYFIGLDKSFNMSDIKDRFVYSEKYGIIAPYFKNGIGKNIYIELLKNDYIMEEISEKIRLFYVALTRAKEKMIMILPTNDKMNNEFYMEIRKKYRSFSDFINSLNEYLTPYIFKFELDNINISKNYNLIKEENYQTKLQEISQRIKFKEIAVANDEIKQNKFSKNINEIITKKDQNNIELGKKFHEILEYLDFHNPNFNNINNEFLKNKIQSFFKSDLLNNLSAAKIYKESEFEYFNNNIKYHGVIDLMIEYDDYINIIDYKLKNIVDDNYINQLNGYKKYVNMLTEKRVNIYLYSILDEKFVKIN